MHINLRQLEGASPGTGAERPQRAETDPCEIILEFSRAEKAEDPYSFPLKEREYRLRMGNGGARSAVFPGDAQFLSDLLALRQPQPDPEVAKRLGERMRLFLDELDWGGYERALECDGGSGRPLRVVIRSAAAELYSLPWELVTQKGTGQHLAELRGCSLSYEWPQENVQAPRAAAPRSGRLLFAWSAAGGMVPAVAHLEALQRACREGDFAFDAQQDVLERVSLRSLSERLKDPSREPVSVLHVLCHGTLLGTQESNVSGLRWNEPEEGAGTGLVDGGMLASILAPHAATLRMVVLSTCNGGDSGILASHLGGVAQELHRAGIETVVASRLPLSFRGSNLLTETLYEKLLVQSCSLDEALSAARCRLREEGVGYDWASLQLYAHRQGRVDLRPVVLRPYRGLLAFEPTHRQFFFGRSELKAALLGRVQQAASGQRPRFQVVAGASGAGKSSLIQAGLVPALSLEEWDWLLLTPGELVRAGQQGSETRSTALQELGQRLHQIWTREPGAVSAGTSSELLEEAQRLRQALPGRKLLLLVDQLEEMFSQLQVSERQALMRGLWALTREQELECVVVATMRVDYFARCGEVLLDDHVHLDGVVYSEAHRLFVAQMSARELTEAIEQPLHRVGLRLEQGLTERLCQDVEQEPGALPLLEHALDLLWQKREGQWLTHTAYGEIGGVAGALTQTAEQLCDGLSPAERQHARRLLVRLAAAQGMSGHRARGRIWVEEVRPQDEEGRKFFEAALEKLVRGRLLVMGSAGEEGTGGRRRWVLLAHDALVHRWRRLRQWVEEDWEREKQLNELETWAEDWEKRLKNEDRGASFLLVGDRLGYVKSLRDKYGGELTPRSQRLLKASLAAEAFLEKEEWVRQEKEKETMRALAQAQARAAQFFQSGFAVAVVLLLGALIAMIGTARLLEREKGLREVAEKTLIILLDG